MKNFKKITPPIKSAIEAEVKMMLHESRDTLRGRGEDTTRISFNVMESCYAEAFGILRALQALGYGAFGPDNRSGLEESCLIDDHNLRKGKTTQDEHNLKWWFNQLKQQVLDEEGFKGDNCCDHCFELHNRDSVRERYGEWVYYKTRERFEHPTLGTIKMILKETDENFYFYEPDETEHGPYHSFTKAASAAEERVLEQ